MQMNNLIIAALLKGLDEPENISADYSIVLLAEYYGTSIFWTGKPIEDLLNDPG